MAVILELFQAGRSGNLIDNWFFETDITTGWTNVNWVTAEQSATYARFGTYSAHFVDATFDGDEQFYTALITGIVVGVEYTSSMWLKKVTCTGTGLMVLNWYTAADVFISNSTVAFDAGAHDWKQYSITATAPATAAKAQVIAFYFTGVTIGTAFDAYIDGVVLSRSDAAVGYLDLNAAAGAGIRMSAWHQAVASPVYGGQPPPIKESFDLMVESTTHDLLAGHIQALDAFRVQADAYVRDRTTEHPVWLECKMNNETGTRRALVRSIDMGYRLPLYSESCGPNQNTTMIRLELWRMPYWEDVAASTQAEATLAAAVSTVFDYSATANIFGDVPARIQDWTIKPANDTDAFGRIWAGLRSADKHGTLVNFVPVWECEDLAGSLGTDAARAADVTASPGGAGDTMVTVTPGTATWSKRLTLETGDVTMNYADNFGRFLWILRAQLEAAGTWEIQLRFGYFDMADADFVRGPIVETSAVAWDLLEMGIATVPMRDLQVLPAASIPLTSEGLWSIQVWARRTVGGAGVVLDLDCICPVPIDEGFISMDGFTASRTSATAYDTLYFAESPQGTRQAVTYKLLGGGLNAKEMVSTSGQSFQYPLGDGRMYIVYGTAAGSDIADQLIVGSKFYERWASLRGAE